jgi:hypothetical protein
MSAHPPAATETESVAADPVALIRYSRVATTHHRTLPVLDI